MNYLSAPLALLLVLALACNTPPAEGGGDTAADKPAATDTATKADPSAPPAPPTPPGKPEPLPAPDDVAAPPADAEKTESGLASKVLKKAETAGEHPRGFDKVSVHYTGWTKDGKMFDSSVARGKPADFPLNRVIPGWTEGVQLMVVGEKRRFWIPGKLAYGDVPKRPGAPSGQLTFDIELLSIEKMAEPPPMPETPKDVGAPPKDAKKTASGLFWKVIKKDEAKGTDKPTAADKVKVHYTGWTKDGKMFDSSVSRGSPAVFPLGGVIPGWTEGLQLIAPGETALFWIPGKLAYGDVPKRPGAPAGQLTFQVTLLEVMK